MNAKERALLKKLYKAVTDDSPLAPSDPRWVPLHGSAAEDPVEQMARVIDFGAARGTAQIFSGFGGTGKSTELRRLAARLEQDGHKVILLDLQGVEGFDLTAPLNPAGLQSLLDAALNPPIEPEQPRSAISRTAKLHLVSVPKTLAGLRKALKGRQLVVLVDSLDHHRLPIVKNAGSLRDLFMDHQALRLPRVHVVYSMPLYVKFQAPTVGSLYDGGALHLVRPVPLQRRDGTQVEESLTLLRRVIEARIGEDWRRLLGAEEHLRALLIASGGVVRDLLRLLANLILKADQLPVAAARVQQTIAQHLAELTPHRDEDTALLARVVTTKEVRLRSDNEVYETEALARLLASHALLGFRDGSEWYDAHPLLRDALLLEAAVPAADPVSSDSQRLPRAALSQNDPLTLQVENYRALRSVTWTLPRGVAVLVGPNGAGKTTLLDIPEFLRHALQRDVRRALDERGGPRDLRNLRASPADLVRLKVSMGDLSWQISLSPKGASDNPLYEEVLAVQGRSQLVAGPERRLAQQRKLSSLQLPRFAETTEGAPFRALLQTLNDYRFYRVYNLDVIRRSGSMTSSDDYLHVDGGNVFSVLRNWRDRTETRSRFDFVIDGLRAAFPDSFHDLDFETAGQTVSGRIQTPQGDTRISTYSASNGWLICLLHLCAVASAESGGVVAIDEPENGLHPFAIRQLISAFRAWAEAHNLSIILATHAPALLDEFKEEPDHVFVMEAGAATLPQALTQLEDTTWLAQFSLGYLYSHDRFGAPQHAQDE